MPAMPVPSYAGQDTVLQFGDDLSGVVVLQGVHLETADLARLLV